MPWLIRRLGLLAVVLFMATTLNFFLPRIAGVDPIRQRLQEQALSGAAMQAGFQDLVASYDRDFGLDRPLFAQYLTYLWRTARLDLGPSIASYPRPVAALLADALPWTIGLFVTATLISFVFGSLIGALAAWGDAPRVLRALLPACFVFSAIPFYLLGLVLMHLLTFQHPWLPRFGAYSVGTVPEWSLGFAFDVVRHGVLPALSMILAGVGSWAVTMRGMMVTVRGEAFMLMAEAKGLKPWRLFFRYGLRNTALPQTTALALALGHLVSGAVLVEVLFGYPGIGSLLLQSIQSFDYFVIQGIVLVVIAAIAVATLLIDLTYPLLDPRLSHGGD